jgi:DNA replication initiation complex subunit (GINS family)
MTTAVRKEVRQGEVQPLHPYFHMVYIKIALEESVDSSPYTEKEFKQKKAKLTQITTERLAKLIKMADSPKINAKNMNLTASEQILMEKIHRWIVNWKELIITSEWGQTE